MEQSDAYIRQLVRQAIRELRRTPCVSVGVSNRHIHLSRRDLDLLFGEGYRLNYTKELLPGQYACQETVDIAGEKGMLRRVRVLGPPRSETQVEISLTDSFALGVKAPVNESGNLSGAAGLAISNGKTGASIRRDCAIIALRHIHMTPAYAEQYGLRDRQLVSVAFDTARGILFPHVLLRVSGEFHNEMHIDLDEANAGGIQTGDIGRIIAAGAT